MNVSSLVITTTIEDTARLVEVLNTGDICEYHFHKEGKIVVTIEGDSVDDEIRKMRQLEQLEHVLNVEMIYSYFEDELDEERGKLEIQNNIPDWLNDDNVKAQDIRYKGTLKI